VRPPEAPLKVCPENPLEMGLKYVNFPPLWCSSLKGRYFCAKLLPPLKIIILTIPLVKSFYLTIRTKLLEEFSIASKLCEFFFFVRSIWHAGRRTLSIESPCDHLWDVSVICILLN
jgi:hypothetical protein